MTRADNPKNIKDWDDLIRPAVLDTGARGSSVTFAQRNQGDVFLSWENEAYLLEKEFGNKIDFIYPSLSILAQPAVTIVDRAWTDEAPAPSPELAMRSWRFVRL